MKVAIIIPARLESTRLPRKLMLCETGKFLIRHTWEQAKQTRYDVYIATDSGVIRRAMTPHGANVIRTGPHDCGTDRVMEAVDQLHELDVVVNWQADEPEINPEDVKQMVEEAFIWQKICTLVHPIELHQAVDPSMVKAVVGYGGRAHYFSRSPVPSGGPYLGHCGIYAFPMSILEEWRSIPCRESELEKSERLEQLRWLEEGYEIHAIQTKHCWGGIDTQADYDNFVSRQKETGS